MANSTGFDRSILDAAGLHLIGGDENPGAGTASGAFGPGSPPAALLEERSPDDDRDTGHRDDAVGDGTGSSGPLPEEAPAAGGPVSEHSEEKSENSEFGLSTALQAGGIGPGGWTPRAAASSEITAEPASSGEEELVLTTDTAGLDGGGSTKTKHSADSDGPLLAKTSSLSGGGATLVVTTASDEAVGASLADDLADGGGLSLREAINWNVAGDTIGFDAALSGMTLTLTGGELALTQDICIDGDIDGDDKADITLSGGNASRIFSISGTGTDAELLSLTLTNGSASAGGSGSFGGAILTNYGTTLDLVDSTLQNNAATIGGGLYSNGALTIINSTIAGNTATNFGGGAMIGDGLSATFINTTIAGNTAGADGGGILAKDNSSLTIQNSTITDNQAGSAGGGIYLFYGVTATVTNSVVALNYGYSGYLPNEIEVAGAYASVNADNSFFGASVTIDSGTGNINGGGDPLLAALADNGGTVQTLAIMTGSALIGAGNTALLPLDTADLDGDGNTTEVLPQDANGGLRIQTSLDIGAVEFVSGLVVTVAGDDAVGASLADDQADGGGLSLREAINWNLAGETISFDAGLAGQTLTLTGGELTLSQDVIIDGDTDGNNEADITLSGGDASRLFILSGSGTDVDLFSLTLTDGYSSANGGAIQSSAGTSLNLVNSTVQDSYAAGNGGGVMSYGTLTAANSTLSGNMAGSDGGGFFVAGGQSATTINTTIYGNTASEGGGGIGTGSAANLTIQNSSLINNLAGSGYYGGGVELYNGATATVTNSVSAQNYAGLLADDFGKSGTNSTLNADNSFFGTAPALIDSGANNIVGGGDPLLGQLLDNGGSVLSLSPLDGSLLIGAGDGALLPLDTPDIDGDGDTSEPLPLDARDELRINTVLDIGAVEQILDEVISGTAGDNILDGGSGMDVLKGLGGNDTLIGGTGDDTLDGGDDTDTASYATSAAGVIVDLGLQGIAQNTGNGSGTDILISIENLIGSDRGDTLTGDGNDNVLDSGLGGDALTGLGGNDTLRGGFSADILLGGDGDDIVEGGYGDDIIDGGAGTDTGEFTGFGGSITVNLNVTTAQFTGGAGTDTITNVENILGGDFNDVFTGKTGDSDLRGGAGADILFGLGGNDFLDGGSGNDKVQGGNGIDTVIGGDGRDTLLGGAGVDTLTGGAENDQLRGGDDGDLLTGGGGRDVLIGGDFVSGGFPGDGAADTFIFTDVSDSSLGGSTRDVIRDFEDGLDIMSLVDIDAITGGTDDAFTLIGTAKFTGTAGELRYFNTATSTIVRGDVDGDGTGDLEILLNGVLTLDGGDFLL